MLNARASTKRILWGVLALALLAPAVGGCSTNPLTGERHLLLLSPDQEIKLGNEASPQMAAEMGGEYDDPVVQQYVNGVGQKLAAEALKTSYAYEYKYTVLDSDMVNAFALPGGPIFITRGLLFQLNDESELAGVLGHETAHVAAQHSNQQLSSQYGQQFMISLIAMLAGESADTVQTVGKFVTAMVNLKYSRGDESQADEFGTKLMHAAGYQPVGMVRVMELFVQQEEEQGASGPEFLRSHPNPKNRVADIQTVIKEDFPGAPTDQSLRVGADVFRKNVLSRRR